MYVHARMHYCEVLCEHGSMCSCALSCTSDLMETVTHGRALDVPPLMRAFHGLEIFGRKKCTNVGTVQVGLGMVGDEMGW